MAEEIINLSDTDNAEENEMRSDFTAAATLLAGLFALGSTAASAQTPPPLSGLARGAFSHPNTGTPSGATIFTPTTSDNLFAAQLVAKIPQSERKQAMRLYTGQINQMVEAAYAKYGYAKNDVGVALGGFLETCWEISHGTFKTTDADAQDQAKTQATVHQMQNALLALPAYKTLPDKNKQLVYEACNFMMGHLVMQWQQAGSDATKKAAVQQMASQQLQSIFGIGASALTRRPDGTFASTTPASGSKAVAGTAPTTHKSNPTPAATASHGPLPAAASHGAQVFVKYTFQATTTTFDQLILFPSGAAFTDVPSKPVTQFDEATLRATLKPYDVGTWKQSGNTLTLTFPNKKRETTTTLRKVARGWYDGDGPPDAESAYNIYYPVTPLTPANLSGAWKRESLSTMGFAGGGAPMVASGSTGTRVFNANGTFSGGSKSFASATTANMGDAFKSGGDVGAYGTNAKHEGGRWRLDGPLLTLESGSQRIVTLAYILPNWKKSGPPDLLIDGDWWKRPDKD